MKDHDVGLGVLVVMSHDALLALRKAGVMLADPQFEAIKLLQGNLEVGRRHIVFAYLVFRIEDAELVIRVFERIRVEEKDAHGQRFP
jgi:hypothetical protein